LKVIIKRPNCDVNKKSVTQICNVMKHSTNLFVTQNATLERKFITKNMPTGLMVHRSNVGNGDKISTKNRCN